MELDDLIKSFVDRGYSIEEATEMAFAANKARKKLAKTETRHNSEFNEETPEEALERWMDEERRDPQGIYSGGATAGGVFGNSVIAMSDYDPEAISRSEDFLLRHRQLQVQERMLGTLDRMEQRQLGERKSGPPLLEDGRGERRNLGKKKNK